MCFPSPPKPPKPPPPPQPPSKQDETLKAQQDAIRRRQGAQMSSGGTVLTSPLGDPGYGQSTGVISATSGVTNPGTRI